MRMKYVVSIGALVLSSTAALAGLVQPQAVVVTLNPDGSGSAIGDMATARFSDNEVEFIGCGVRRFIGGATFAFCQATTADEVAGFCSTDDPHLIESLAAASDFSFITFSWDAAGVCRSIGNSTQSFYIPDSKKSKK